MTEHDPIADDIDATSEEKRSDARSPRSIRFSDSEWERVETAADGRGIAAAEFVRHAARALPVTNPLRTPPRSRPESPR